MKRPDSPTLRETLRGLKEDLSAAGLESPGVEAERLLAHVLGLERSRLALELDAPLPGDAAAELARLAARRASGVPLQHIEETVAFRDLVLRADRRALIPRPETEQLVDLIARELRERPSGPGVRTIPRPGAARPTAARPVAGAATAALDVGTGGGAIALSLALEGLARRVVGLDVSEAALDQARDNRALAGLRADQVDLRLTGADPFDALGRDEEFDLLVSNPPYVRDGEIDLLAREVRDHEPRQALAGGPDGLDLVRTIAARAPAHLASGARLFLEIGADQGDAATAVFEGDPSWDDVRRHADLAGRDRFLTARRR